MVDVGKINDFFPCYGFLFLKTTYNPWIVISIFYAIEFTSV